MARKATDLLDVFRYGGEDDSDEKRRGKHRGGQRAARAASAGRRSGSRAAQAGKSASGKSGAGTSAAGRRKSEGIHLTPRHLLLASCALVLLLVLSFTLGLATGRPGHRAGQASSLQRQTPVAIRATLPLIDPASRKQVDPKRIRRTLQHDYRIRAANLHIWKEGGRIILEVGPFPSRSAAESYLRRSGLEMAHLNMDDPFRWPEYTTWRP